MQFRRGLLPFFIATLGVFWAANTAFAAVVDFSSFNSITGTMASFLADVDALVNAVFANSDISGFVYREWTFFTILLIGWWAFDYWAMGFSMRDLVQLVLMIGLTRVLIIYYDSITSAFWHWSVSFAEGIQMAAVGNTDLFFLPSYIFNVCNSLIVNDMNFFTNGVLIILAVGIATIFAGLVAVVSVFTASWAIWGYAVAKIVGWMFIPMLMFQRLEWLFEGWLRFFFGFLVYGVLARVNLILVAFVIKGMTGSGAITPLGGPTMQLDISSFQDLSGLFCFLLIGLLGLLSTSKFATAIAGGAGGGGGGGMVRAAVMFATKGLK